MKNVCLIPARGGSKRLPKKNIKLFHNKPLIAWSIEEAISSKIFDEVFVSTDDEEIADISKNFGAKIPFIRPKELANDHANDKDVRNHFINWMKTNNIHSNYLCYLYATAPFINKETLLGCLELLINNDVTCTHTITSYDYPVQRALERDEKGLVEFKWDDYANSRSQDLEDLYHDAGQCYFYDLSKYNDVEKRLGFILPRHACQDIDTAEDFIVAEKLFTISKSNIF